MPPALPSAGETEDLVIGACLQSQKAVEQALAGCKPEHFFTETNAVLFRVITELHALEEVVDIATIMRRLDMQHAFENLPPWRGGKEAAHAQMISRLSQQLLVATRTDNVTRHCEIIKEMWGKRHLIEVLVPPMTSLRNGARPDKVMRDVERVLVEARQLIEDEGATAVIDGFSAAQWLSEHVKNPPDPKAGIGTPFAFLGRFQPGRLYVIGGYPKDGKTALSVQFLSAACNDGAHVGYCSVEMSWQDLTTRIASTFGVPYTQLQSGHVSAFAQEAFELALASITNWRIEIIDDASLSPGELVRHQRLKRYDYIIIDYLQRMPYADRHELNQVIKAITTLARKAQIPILLLSQFSRPQNTTPSNPYPRPNMSMFAETSVIEKEAAMAMSVWRKRDEEGNPGSEAELNVMANRYGQPGLKPMFFDGEKQRFTEVARYF